MRRLGVTMEGLVALVTIAQEGNLERGGAVLGLSKSALGKQIATLEQAVGARLFEHRRGKWILNEEGKRFVPEAFRSIFHARMGVDLVKSHVRLQTDHIAIGYSTFLSPVLIAIIKQLRLQRGNDVRIELESCWTESSVQKVLRGELDAGFGYLPINQPGLLVRTVFEEPLSVCLPEGHALAAKHSIPPESLEGLAMIAIARRALPLRFEEIEEHFGSLGIKLRFVEECLSSTEALASVARGIGVCFFPTSRARSGDGVVTRPLKDRLLMYRSGVFVRQDNEDEAIGDLLQLVLGRTTPYRKHSSHGVAAHDLG
jgi:DNA-binding transcriptional LysR family regulator